MQKKKLLRFGLTSIVLVASLLLLGLDKPSKKPTPTENKPTCCKKLDIQNCPAKSKQAAPGDLILGNFSNQFISISSFY